MRVIPFKDQDKTLHGIDISAWQGDVDMSIVVGKSKFTILKATEGLHYVSPNFAPEWEEAKMKGLIRGAYHFFSTGIDGIQQAEFFCSKFKLEFGDLPVVLDLEPPWHYSDVPKALNFLNACERITGVTPMIYSSPYPFQDLIASYLANSGDPNVAAAFARFPLWIANYGVPSPSIPEPFKDWKFWQYTDSYYLDPAHSKIDANYFNGDFNDLLAFTKQAPKVDIPPMPPPVEKPKSKCWLLRLFGL